jgi:hypothetical protein
MLSIDHEPASPLLILKPQSKKVATIPLLNNLNNRVCKLIISGTSASQDSNTGPSEFKVWALVLYLFHRQEFP